MRTQVTIRVRASRAEVMRVLRSVPAMASGAGKAGGLERALKVRVALAAQARIKTAFVTKARGGTDEAGLRWKPLSPATIAYSRRHRKVGRQGQKLKSYLPGKTTRAAFRPSYALSKAQRSAWWGHYVRYLGKYQGDKGHAAAAAWVVLKAQGATTLMEQYGGTQVEILRDTGMLLNSLTPILPPDAAGPDIPRKANQVFRLLPKEVIIGTNRLWAWTHHQGVPGHIPQRLLWPDPSNWPQTWWDDLLIQAREGIIDIVLFLLKGGNP